MFFFFFLSCSLKPPLSFSHRCLYLQAHFLPFVPTSKKRKEKNHQTKRLIRAHRPSHKEQVERLTFPPPPHYTSHSTPPSFPSHLSLPPYPPSPSPFPLPFPFHHSPSPLLSWSLSLPSSLIRPPPPSSSLSPSLPPLPTPLHTSREQRSNSQ